MYEEEEGGYIGGGIVGGMMALAWAVAFQVVGSGCNGKENKSL
jgi:hypothetical protein